MTIPDRPDAIVAGERAVSLRRAMARGLIGRCPNCGKGRLFARYLKQVENCAVCGERFGQIRADDAAPWATIIFVGHVFLPLAFFINWTAYMSEGAALTMLVSFFVALSLLVLPRAKGMMLAILWVTHAPGYSS